MTNSGASAVLAVDELIANGGELTPLTDRSVQALERMLPNGTNAENPVDLGDDAGPSRYAAALEIAANDENSSGMLVILTPHTGSDPAAAARALTPYSSRPGRPLLASWMGGREADAGIEVLNRAHIPTFAFPDTAARVFSYMWRSAYNLRGIYETPSLPSDSAGAPDRESAGRIIRAAREQGRTLLTELESKEILAAYRLPVVQTCLAGSEADAVSAAEEIGYPVVLKVHSETISHKAEAGGVRLGLRDERAVRRAYADVRRTTGEAFQGVTVQPMIGGRFRSPLAGLELILGSALDAQFGPVILFGTGGRTVELLADAALALPPLNTTLARRMMEQTRIYRALLSLSGARQGDLAALEQVIVRFSQLVVEQPFIREIDINPLYYRLAEGDSPGTLALDARMILHAADVSAEGLPRPAIRPYPAQYVYEWTTRQGLPLLIRPIRPEDEPLMASFHATLSERTVYLRYLHTILLDQRVAHDRLARICFNDYDREFALVAERRDAETGLVEIVGVGRLSRLHKRNDAEFAILVSDSFQGHGLGTELLRKLVDIAREERIDRVVGFISAENRGMLSVCRRLGFRIKHSLEESEVEAIYDLTGTGSRPQVRQTES
ncbi:MAG: bifunctional acetate--CoA ligase family protein/GNAT family N-acetyltransferase [Rudaea sp.]